MATRPTDPGPVLGRVDANGRLVSADPELERLQRDAGSRMGAPIAIPQLAAISRMAQQLKIPVSRRAVAAGSRHDIDMWVRAVPEDDGVALTIERWSARAPGAARHGSATLGEVSPSPESRRWTLDEQLRFVSISEGAAELFGVGVAEATGQALTRIVRLQEDDSGEMPMLQALAARDGFAGQVARRRSDDAEIILSGEVLGTGDAFVGFEGFVARPGETERSQAERQVERELDDVLRSPLHRIIDAADRMADRCDGPLRNEYASYAADISAAANHLLSVVRSMGEEGKASEATIDLVELVSEAVALMESGALEREIAVAIEAVHSLPARGESRSVVQILVNLIGNAVRHSPRHSAVTISFERSADRSIVHVADDGPGIDPADHERIFERFQRGRDGGEGSGLGLAIARRLARSMGGDIQLASSPGVGSRFSLVLPAG